MDGEGHSLSAEGKREGEIPGHRRRRSSLNAIHFSDALIVTGALFWDPGGSNKLGRGGRRSGLNKLGRGQAAIRTPLPSDPSAPPLSCYTKYFSWSKLNLSGGALVANTARRPNCRLPPSQLVRPTRVPEERVPCN